MELSREKLAQAYLALDRGEWPEWLEGKPKGYDELPLAAKPPKECKLKYQTAKMVEIAEAVGLEALNREIWEMEGAGTEADFTFWWETGGRLDEEERLEGLKEALQRWTDKYPDCVVNAGDTSELRLEKRLEKLERRVNDMDVTVGLVSGAQDALMEDFYSKGRAIWQVAPAVMALLAALVALAASVLQTM